MEEAQQEVEAIEKSTHRVEVVRINEIRKHPNADNLGIVDVWGYTTCTQLGGFKPGDLAAFIPPDSICPDSPEFEFLGKHRRIRAKKLRGVVSFGLLMPAPEGAQEGDNVAEQMGIIHYEPEPEMPSSPFKIGTPQAPAPPGWYPKYDVDSLYRYKSAFVPGEAVIVHEKVHGSNCLIVYSEQDKKFHIRSRTRWLIDTPENIYWRAFRNSQFASHWLKKNPDMVLYGEVVPCQRLGNVSFDYGWPWDQPQIYFFDILHGTRFLDADEVEKVRGPLLWAPVVKERMPFDFDLLKDFCEGPSLTSRSNHLREGIVVKPIKERYHDKIGRVNLKMVSPAYLELK